MRAFIFCRYFQSEYEGIYFLQVFQSESEDIYLQKVLAEGNNSIFLRRSFFPLGFEGISYNSEPF